jgi:hypothetical protein
MITEWRDVISQKGFINHKDLRNSNSQNELYLRTFDAAKGANLPAVPGRGTRLIRKSVLRHMGVISALENTYYSVNLMFTIPKCLQYKLQEKGTHPSNTSVF